MLNETLPEKYIPYLKHFQQSFMCLHIIYVFKGILTNLLYALFEAVYVSALNLFQNAVQ